VWPDRLEVRGSRRSVLQGEGGRAGRFDGTPGAHCLTVGLALGSSNPYATGLFDTSIGPAVTREKR
jgi:hypothetical protein